MPLTVLTREKYRYRLCLALADLVAGVAAVVVAYLAVFPPSRPGAELPWNYYLYLVLVPCWVLSLFFHYQYDFHPRWRTAAGAYRNLRAAVVGSLVGIALLFLWDPKLDVSRKVYLLATLMAAALFTLMRLVAIRFFPGRVLQERYLILGAPTAEGELVRELSNGQMPPYVEVVGCLVGEGGDEAQQAESPVEVLGTLEDMTRILLARKVTHVAICPDVPRTPALAHAASQAEALGATVGRLETLYEALTGRAPVLLAGADWADQLYSVQASVYMTRYKRVLDLLVVLMWLPLGLVLMGAAAVCIRIWSPGPVFYRQRRVGHDGKEFTFTKLRTMVVDAEKETGAVWASKDDPRITPVGSVLRKYRLDEVPQLFSVLKGDMSIVGPRPERPEFVKDFIRDIPLYEKRLLVRPGITGWAQINHKYDETVDDVVEKLRYDLYYVRHMCFTLDLQILMATLWVMLGRKGAK